MYSHTLISSNQTRTPMPSQWILLNEKCCETPRRLSYLAKFVIIIFDRFIFTRDDAR